MRACVRACARCVCTVRVCSVCLVCAVCAMHACVHGTKIKQKELCSFQLLVTTGFLLGRPARPGAAAWTPPFRVPRLCEADIGTRTSSARAPGGPNLPTSFQKSPVAVLAVQADGAGGPGGPFRAAQHRVRSAGGCAGRTPERPEWPDAGLARPANRLGTSHPEPFAFSTQGGYHPCRRERNRTHAFSDARDSARPHPPNSQASAYDPECA